jgi:hypothetical protein
MFLVIFGSEQWFYGIFLKITGLVFLISWKFWDFVFLTPGKSWKTKPFKHVQPWVILGCNNTLSQSKSVLMSRA